MTNFGKKLTESWQDGISLLLGIWLFMSPWQLAFTGTSAAFWTAVVFGVVIVLMALMVLFEFHEWEEWADMAIGLWLIVAPWAMGFVHATGISPNVIWNFVTVGVLIFGLAIWSLRGHRAHSAA